MFSKQFRAILSILFLFGTLRLPLPAEGSYDYDGYGDSNQPCVDIFIESAVLEAVSGGSGQKLLAQLQLEDGQEWRNVPSDGAQEITTYFSYELHISRLRDLQLQNLLAEYSLASDSNQQWPARKLILALKPVNDRRWYELDIRKALLQQKAQISCWGVADQPKFTVRISAGAASLLERD